MKNRRPVLILPILLSIAFVSGTNSLQANDDPKEGDALATWIDKARIRTSPGLEPQSIGNLNEGEVVTFLKKSNITAEATLRGKEFVTPFYYIERSNGEKGWVYGGAFALMKYKNPLTKIAFFNEELLVLTEVEKNNFKIDTNPYTSDVNAIIIANQRIIYRDYGDTTLNVSNIKKISNKVYHIYVYNTGTEKSYKIVLSIEKDNRIVWNNFFSKGEKIWSTPIKYKENYEYLDVDFSDFEG